MAVRAAFANSELKNSNGESTSVHYGVFNSLISLKEMYSSHTFVMFWDGKSKRRMRESMAAVEKRIITSAYKANRDKEEMPKPLLDFYAQAPILKKAIDKAGIAQIRFPEYETDDVIASYAKILKSAHDIVLVTTDRDYYQLLDSNVVMWDGMKNKLTTKQDFVDEYKISPQQYVDVGAFCGDSGDNIFGVPGWGDKTALKAIQEYETWQNTLKKLHEELDPVRAKFPDLNAKDFQELKNFKTPKEKPKYPEITENMPFTGVALALEKGEWKPEEKSGVKNRVMALMFEERVALAHSLKKMDDEIENLPELTFDAKCDKEKIMEYFNYYDIESLKSKIDNF